MATLNLGRVRINFRGDFDSLNGEELVWYDAITFRGSLYVVLAESLIVSTGEVGNNPLGVASESYLLLAKGVNYAGEWVPGKIYYENEMVKYGGSTYICIQTTLRGDTRTPQSYSVAKDGTWIELASGLGKYVPNYNGSQKLNNTDIVSWKGTLYIAIKDIPAGTNPTTEPTSFDVVAAGYSLEGQYSSLRRYAFRDTVVFHGCSYSVTNELGTANAPINSVGVYSSDWVKNTSGLEYVGIFDPLHDGYYPGDVVTYGRDAYAVVTKTFAGEDPESIPAKYTRVISSANINLEELINIDSSKLTNGSLLQYNQGMWHTTNHIEDDTGDLTISGGEF